MPIFTYQARTKEGTSQEGLVEASSRPMAEETLRQQGMTIIALALQAKKPFIESTLSIFNPITSKDKMLFFRQLSTMIEATLPIVQALRILANQARNPKFKNMIERIVHEVEGGAALSGALALFPDVFNEFHIGLIRAGETSGKLDETLIYLADQLEKDYDLLSKVRGALVYPIIILVGVVVVGALMMVMVVPQLTAILEEAGQELPWTTRTLIFASSIMHDFWWALLLVLCGIVLFVIWYRRQPAGSEFFDLLKLKIPIVGLVFKYLYLVRFTLNFSTLLASGVPIAESLRIVSGVIDNYIYSEAILRVQQGVESGESLARIFQREEIFPPIIVQMVRVGERTGRLVDVLDKLATFYNRELDVAMKSLFAAIEPTLMVILGIAVGIIVGAILMPIYDLASAI